MPRGKSPIVQRREAQMLAFMYEALDQPIGIAVVCQQVSARNLISRFNALRKKTGDERLSALTFRTDPQEPEHTIWIAKHSQVGEAALQARSQAPTQETASASDSCPDLSDLL